jgi:hypothetical protein
VIAIAAVVSTILTSTALGRQGQDANLLEVITQQISLSETMENAAFDVEAAGDVADRVKAATRLDTNLGLLRGHTLGLRYGSDSLDLPPDHSRAFNDHFEAGIEPHFGAMTRLAEELIENASSGAALRVGSAADLARASEEFREGMKGLATLVKEESQARLARLRITQIVLLSVMLLLLIVEGLFLFRPAVRDVRREWEQRAAEHESERAQDQQKLS